MFPRDWKPQHRKAFFNGGSFLWIGFSINLEWKQLVNEQYNVLLMFSYQKHPVPVHQFKIFGCKFTGVDIKFKSRGSNKLESVCKATTWIVLEYNFFQGFIYWHASMKKMSILASMVSVYNIRFMNLHG
jgi:hypothetical protein